MKRSYIALALGFSGLALLPIAAREPLAARIAHSDPSKYRHSPAVHGGAGSLDFTALFDAHTLEPNLQFLHRGVGRIDAGKVEGEFSVHSDLLVHGSEANASGRRRCGLTLRYCPADVRAALGWNEKGVIVSGSDPSGHWANPPRPEAD